MAVTNPYSTRIHARWKRIKQEYPDILVRSFTPDGINVVAETFNGFKRFPYSTVANSVLFFKLNRVYRDHISSWFAILTTFFGLPNELTKIEPGVALSWQMIAANFIGYRANRGWKNIFFALYKIPLNSILTPLKFLTNVARLFTEILPLVVRELSFFLEDTILTMAAESWAEEELGWKLLFTSIFSAIYMISVIPLYSIILATYVWEYVGRSLTSPIDSLRSDWKNWQQRYDWNEKYGWPTWLLVIGLRLITILVAYSLLFPLFAKGAGVLLLPTVVAHTPAALLIALHAVASGLTAVGHALAFAAPAFAAFVSNLAMGFAPLSAVVAGVALLAALWKEYHDKVPTSQAAHLPSSPAVSSSPVVHTKSWAERKRSELDARQAASEAETQQTVPLNAVKSSTESLAVVSADGERKINPAIFLAASTAAGGSEVAANELAASPTTTPTT